MSQNAADLVSTRTEYPDAAILRELAARLIGEGCRPEIDGL
jgi:hypothetical protein